MNKEHLLYLLRAVFLEETTTVFVSRNYSMLKSEFTGLLILLDLELASLQFVPVEKISVVQTVYNNMHPIAAQEWRNSEQTT